MLSHFAEFLQPLPNLNLTDLSELLVLSLGAQNTSAAAFLVSSVFDIEIIRYIAWFR